MIDWLDFTIELQHPTIEQGGFVVFDHTGEITRGSQIGRRVEGSFSSTIEVSSISSIPFYSDVMLELGLYKGIDNATQSSAIAFRGNPTKYLQGHNVIGTDCMRALASETVKDVFPKLGLSNRLMKKALRKINDFDFYVTRIDITKMFDLGSDNNVNDYLYMMPLTVKARGDRCDYTKSTFYVGKHSTIWTFKFYNKLKELLSKSKHHRLNPIFNDTNLLQFIEGKLRAELTLRKKELDRLKLTSAKHLHSKLNELFNEYIGRFTMTNQTANFDKLNTLSNTYRATYYDWEKGLNMKSRLKNSSFYVHKKVLLGIGVDISKPPIPSGERRINIEPITKMLAPKVVSWRDIPSDLMPYIIQPIKDNHLRVA